MLAQVLVQDRRARPELRDQKSLGKPRGGLLGSGWGWGQSLVGSQPRLSGLQLHRTCPGQSEFENRNIKEITDTFTLVQVVDVIVVSGRWRKSEEGGKHCRKH